LGREKLFGRIDVIRKTEEGFIIPLSMIAYAYLKNRKKETRARARA